VFKGGSLKPEMCLDYLQEKAELRCWDWCWEDLSKPIISSPRAPLEPNPNISAPCSETTERGPSLHLPIHHAMMETVLTSTVLICFTAPFRKRWAKRWHLHWVLIQHLALQ